MMLYDIQIQNINEKNVILNSKRNCRFQLIIHNYILY